VVHDKRASIKTWKPIKSLLKTSCSFRQELLPWSSAKVNCKWSRDCSILSQMLGSWKWPRSNHQVVQNLDMVQWNTMSWTVLVNMSRDFSWSAGPVINLTFNVLSVSPTEVQSHQFLPCLPSEEIRYTGPTASSFSILSLWRLRSSFEVSKGLK